MQNTMSHTPSRFLLWIPLVLSQIYLGLTLLVLVAGPIEWTINNPVKFWSLLGSYHLMFIAGYWWTLRQQPFRHPGWAGLDFSDHLHKHFWLLLALTTIAMLIGHRNLTMSASYLPTDFIGSFYRGIANPLDGYLFKLSDQAKANFSGNTFATGIFSLLIICKILLINLLVTKWPVISWQKRISGLTVTMIPLVSAVSVGTNKPIFDLLFYFSSVLLFNLIMSSQGGLKNYLTQRKTIVVMVVALATFFPYYFQHTMSQRASMDINSYVQSKQKIIISANFLDSSKPTSSLDPSKPTQFLSSQVRLLVITTSNYLTQGYYGMSLAIDQPFESTYGVGNSDFLLVSLNKHLGIDLKPRTFQRKISGEWNENQWHTMYTQLANDLSFFGVGIAMFGLGFISAAVWISATIFNNFAARCMVPLFVIMFIFIPANNQIFNMLENMSTFMLLITLWIIGFVKRTESISQTAPAT